MSTWLDGMRALVVGGGSGIGRGVVEAFVEEGAHVGVLELDSAKCAELHAQAECVVVQGDATHLGDNERAVDALINRYGGLDILVNCVGVFDFNRGIADIQGDDLPSAFDEIFRANVASQILSVKAALPALQASRGSIVLTVSTSGFYPGRGGVLYVATKFAVRGLVIALAHDLAPDVRVNGVAPGGTLGTDLRGLASLGLESERLDSDPNREADLRARTPLHVALTPKDHAWSYVFLASRRSQGITGTFVHSDGGRGVRE
ncbi:MAG: 3-(cis-5,6-dihydroxycyclohexa-1,3-dien-1-yl)propanoate dehydrogenase [Acidimicrobiales bacterium]